MSRQEVIANLIKGLEQVIIHPTMYMGRATYNAADIFIYGYSSAYGAVGIPQTLDLRRQATNSRGWEFTSLRGADKMRK